MSYQEQEPSWMVAKPKADTYSICSYLRARGKKKVMLIDPGSFNWSPFMCSRNKTAPQSKVCKYFMLMWSLGIFYFKESVCLVFCLFLECILAELSLVCHVFLLHHFGSKLGKCNCFQLTVKKLRWGTFVKDHIVLLESLEKVLFTKLRDCL